MKTPAPDVCGKPDDPARKEAMKGAGGQSRAMSGLEALLNTGIGYVISFAATIAVLPAFGVSVGAGQAAGISASFTVISIVRSYALRRVFNAIGKSK